MQTQIISNCERCNNEDSISCFTGLCPSCEELEQDEEFKQLEKENNTIRDKIEDIIRQLPIKDYNKLNDLIEDLILCEIEQEKYCNN